VNDGRERTRKFALLLRRANHALRNGLRQSGVSSRDHNECAAIIERCYNAAGQRVQKIIGNTTYSYFYDLSGKVVAEWYGTPGGYNGWGKGYVYLGGQLVAQYADSTTHFVHKDHLGSTRLLTKVDQSVQETLDFLPYGEQLNSTAATTSHKFTGKERDSESGLDNFKARYFGSSMGRFSSPDPLMIMRQKLTDPQQWNMYAYVRNNPLRFLDPTGMYICGGTEKECAAFEKARQSALKSKDKDTVRAAKAYGDPGKDNGVNVGFAKELKGDRGGQVTRRGGGLEADPNSPNGLRATLNVTIKSDLAGDEETIAHEGSHVADNQDFVNAITPDGKIDQSLNITLRASEIRAYLVSIGYAQRGNKTLNFGPCGVMGECKFPPGMMPALRDQRINDLLNTQYDSKMLDKLLYPELKP
jgi:RHS repeat-associated protein